MERITLRGDLVRVFLFGVVGVLFLLSLNIVSGAVGDIERVYGSCESDSSQSWSGGSQTCSYSINFDYARNLSNPTDTKFYNSVDLGYSADVRGGYLNGECSQSGGTVGRNFPYSQDCSLGCPKDASYTPCSTGCGDNYNGWSKGVYHGWDGFLNFGCIDPLCNYYTADFEAKVLASEQILENGDSSYSFNGRFGPDNVNCLASIAFTEVKEKEKIDISSVEISPDFYKEYPTPPADGSMISYSDIFERPMNCSVVVNDPDIKKGKINVDIQVNVDNPLRKEASGKPRKGNIFNATQECTRGEWCEFSLPLEKIYPADKLVCNASVKDTTGKILSKISEINKLPAFDLQIKKVKVMNVIDIPFLIIEKAHMARVWVGFESDRINYLDVPITVNFSQTNYPNPQGTRQITEVFKSEAVDHLRNYPALEALKLNPDKMAPLTTYASLLKDVKEGKDSVNIFGLNKLKPTYVGASSFKFWAEIEPLNVKESNIVNNLCPPTAANCRTSGNFVFRQVKNFTMMTFVAGKGVTDAQRNLAITNMNIESDFFRMASPLVAEKVNVLPGAAVIPLSYDDATIQIVLSNPEGMIARRQINNLFSQASRQVRVMMGGVDLAVIYISNDTLFDAMVIAAGKNPKLVSGFYSPQYPKMVWLRVSAADQLSPARLLHEAGHALAGLPDEYIIDYDSLSFITQGNFLTQTGWALNQKTGASLGPRINIWTEPDSRTLKFPNQDLPEHDANLMSNENLQDLGVRYFNLMGAGTAGNIWVNLQTYSRFVTKFQMSGYLR